jgi:hypothetical protein
MTIRTVLTMTLCALLTHSMTLPTSKKRASGKETPTKSNNSAPLVTITGTSILAQALAAESKQLTSENTASVIEKLNTFCTLTTELKAINARLDAQLLADNSKEAVVAKKMKDLLINIPTFAGENAPSAAQDLLSAFAELQKDAAAFEKAAVLLDPFFKHLESIGTCMYSYSQTATGQDILVKVFETKKVKSFGDLLALS